MEGIIYKYWSALVAFRLSSRLGGVAALGGAMVLSLLAMLYGCQGYYPGVSNEDAGNVDDGDGSSSNDRDDFFSDGLDLDGSDIADGDMADGDEVSQEESEIFTTCEEVLVAFQNVWNECRVCDWEQDCNYCYTSGSFHPLVDDEWCCFVPCSDWVVFEVETEKLRRHWQDLNCGPGYCCDGGPPYISRCINGMCTWEPLLARLPTCEEVQAAFEDVWVKGNRCLHDSDCDMEKTGYIRHCQQA